MTDEPRPQTRLRAAGLLWATAAAMYVTVEACAAAAFPGYSYANNYISDLGVPSPTELQARMIDSPLAWLMNAMFITHGALFVVAGVVASRSAGRGPARGAFAALALVHGVGISLVGIFHGSSEAVSNGTLAIHGAGAAMAIIAGNLAAIVSGSSSRLWFTPQALRLPAITLGLLGLVFVAMLLINQTGGTPVLFEDGMWERLSVYTFLGWELAIGVALLRDRTANANA